MFCIMFASSIDSLLVTDDHVARQSHPLPQGSCRDNVPVAVTLNFKQLSGKLLPDTDEPSMDL